MEDLIATVDWSRAQFALTAMYHWLFEPLTIAFNLDVMRMLDAAVRSDAEHREVQL